MLVWRVTYTRVVKFAYQMNFLQYLGNLPPGAVRFVQILI